jgi:hypothetical protein
MENQNAQELQVLSTEQSHPQSVSFGNSQQFEHAQRVAKMLSVSNLIPENFRNNIPNTMIALEMANRIGASPLMVMQNMYVVHGKPSWSSQFIISAINACGRFTPLRFEVTGTGDTLSCVAWAYEKGTKDRLDSPTVTMAMAIAEGWVNKSGSKWKTMPELMIRYRAAAFFGRLYAPDILMGMQTAEEVDDFTLMATSEQEQQIELLMDTCTFDEQRKRGIMWKLRNGATQGEAFQFIQELRANQLDPVTHGGAYNQKDIKEHLNKAI